MKRVDLEIRTSLLNMLSSGDSETRTLGWVMFVNEYQEEILRRIRICMWPDLTNRTQAIDFLIRSISASKRKKK